MRFIKDKYKYIQNKNISSNIGGTRFKDKRFKQGGNKIEQNFFNFVNANYLEYITCNGLIEYIRAKIGAESDEVTKCIIAIIFIILSIVTFIILSMNGIMTEIYLYAIIVGEILINLLFSNKDKEEVLNGVVNANPETNKEDETETKIEDKPEAKKEDKLVKPISFLAFKCLYSLFLIGSIIFASIYKTDPDKISKKRGLVDLIAMIILAVYILLQSTLNGLFKWLYVGLAFIAQIFVLLDYKNIASIFIIALSSIFLINSLISIIFLAGLRSGRKEIAKAVKAVYNQTKYHLGPVGVILSILITLTGGNVRNVVSITSVDETTLKEI